MSGVSAGVSGSYGQSSTDMNSSTTNSQRGGTTSDFASLLRELMNSTTTERTNAPRWAKVGSQNMFADETGARQVAMDFLSTLMADPYGTDGGGKFGGAINHMFQSALANARTGADTSSMGAARQGFREGEALAGAQRDVLGLGQQAAGTIMGNTDPSKALSFSALIAPKTSTTNVNKTQDTSGRTTGTNWSNGKSNTVGSQDSTSWGVGGGVGCCFIFMEAYHGNMPWFVRRCRDEFATGRRVLGYRRMAEWAVPMMKQSPAFRWLVNRTMIQPLTKFGGWLYAQPEKQYKRGWLYAPVTAAWFYFWSKYAPKTVQEV